LEYDILNKRLKEISKIKLRMAYSLDKLLDNLISKIEMELQMSIPAFHHRKSSTLISSFEIDQITQNLRKW